MSVIVHKLLVATGNKGKLKEITALLNGAVATFLTLGDLGESEDVEETGSTFEENAVLKAEHFFNQTGIITCAEDSGLEVDALNGRPGVYSARYAGGQVSDEDNNRKLLAELGTVPEGRRNARFVCAVAFAMPGNTKLFRGVVKGAIAHEARGIHGFGYDPLFIPDGYNKSFAELGAEIKNTISHRFRALKKLQDYVMAFADKPV